MFRKSRACFNFQEPLSGTIFCENFIVLIVVHVIRDFGIYWSQTDVGPTNWTKSRLDLAIVRSCAAVGKFPIDFTIIELWIFEWQRNLCCSSKATSCFVFLCDVLVLLPPLVVWDYSLCILRRYFRRTLHNTVSLFMPRQRICSRYQEAKTAITSATWSERRTSVVCTHILEGQLNMAQEAEEGQEDDGTTIRLDRQNSDV